MAKRKTRQEKIKSDYRRSLSFGQESTFSYQISPKKEEVTQKQTQVQKQTTATVAVSRTIIYPYLQADLRKTMLLTICIVVIQFALYFLLKNHVVTFPGFIY